jgi:cupin 2 domain-containing protein
MNIYDIPDPAKEREHFVPLHRTPTLKIEAIRSRLTQPGEIYDQDEDEWVILVRGEAKLDIEGALHTLHAGDSLYLKQHTRHRVLMTSDDALWLGVFSS